MVATQDSFSKLTLNHRYQYLALEQQLRHWWRKVPHHCLHLEITTRSITYRNSSLSLIKCTNTLQDLLLHMYVRMCRCVQYSLLLYSLSREDMELRLWEENTKEEIIIFESESISKSLLWLLSFHITFLNHSISFSWIYWQFLCELLLFLLCSSHLSQIFMISFYCGREYM